MSTDATQLELLSDSPEQTRALGAKLARSLRGGQVVALVGHLGAGKTQWVKGLAAGLGIDPDDVHSPTFTLINEYEPAASPAVSGPGHNKPVSGPEDGPARQRDVALLLYHVDAYRLNSSAELEAIGFGEMVAAGDGIVAVEWADRVAELIPADAVWIEGFMPSHLAPSQRQYVIRSIDAELVASIRS